MGQYQGAHSWCYEAVSNGLKQCQNTSSVDKTYFYEPFYFRRLYNPGLLRGTTEYSSDYNTVSTAYVSPFVTTYQTIRCQQKVLLLETDWTVARPIVCKLTFAVGESILKSYNYSLFYNNGDNNNSVEK